MEVSAFSFKGDTSYSAKRGAMKITSDGFFSSEFSKLSKSSQILLISVIKISLLFDQGSNFHLKDLARLLIHRLL